MVISKLTFSSALREGDANVALRPNKGAKEFTNDLKGAKEFTTDLVAESVRWSAGTGCLVGADRLGLVGTGWDCLGLVGTGWLLGCLLFLRLWQALVLVLKS